MCARLADSVPGRAGPEHLMRRRPDGTGTPGRSVLGPQLAGKRRTTAGRSGHRTLPETAGRFGDGLLTSGSGDDRCGVRVSPPAAASHLGPCPRPSGSPRTGLTLGRSWSRRRHEQISSFSPAVPPACHNSGHTRYPADSHGHFEAAVGLGAGLRPGVGEEAETAWHARGQGFKSLSSTFSALFKLGREKRGANTSENSARPMRRSLM